MSVETEIEKTELGKATRRIEAGDYEEAKRIYCELILKGTKNHIVYGNLGALYAKDESWRKVIECLKVALKIKQSYIEAICNLGIAYKAIGEFDNAINLYLKSNKLNGYNANISYNLGNIYMHLNLYSLAIDAYNRSITIKPDYIEAYLNLGNAYKKSMDEDKAIKMYKTAVEKDSNFYPALVNIGNILMKKGLLHQSIEYYEMALNSNPGIVDIYNNIGSIYRKLGNLKEAEKWYKNGLLIDKDEYRILSNLGLIKKDLGLQNEAMKYYKKSLEKKPNEAYTLANIGELLHAKRKYKKAIDFYNKALSADSNMDSVTASVINCECNICDWSMLNERRKWTNKLLSRKTIISPLYILSICDSPEVQKKVSENLCAKYKITGENIAIKIKNKIRIGYISANFNEHPVSNFLLDILCHHDKSRYEIYCYSIGYARIDKKTDLIKDNSTNFKDLKDMSEDLIVDTIRKDSIDIAIDLMGHTSSSQMGIFYKKIAPIQITYLGYPGTTGAQCFDYLISDRIIIPKKYQSNYTEKIIYLPNYFYFDNPKDTNNSINIKEKLGLSKETFIYGCFNSNYKITDLEFDVWMRILSSTEDSVLWLISSNDDVIRNLKDQAESRGVKKERVIFSAKTTLEKHIERSKCADIFLDTFSYNAFITSWISLKVGVPLLTLQGRSFAARVGSSLLSTLDLEELICYNKEEYFEKACTFCKDKNQLEKIVIKLFNSLSKKNIGCEDYVRLLEKRFYGLVEEKKNKN